MKTKKDSHPVWKWSMVGLACFSLVAGDLAFAKDKPTPTQSLPPEENNIVTMAGREEDLGNGGPATEAVLAQNQGIAIDNAGNTYLCEVERNIVRKVGTTGIITTVVGTGAAGSSGNGGPATQAKLNNPRNVAVDPTGNLYVSEFFGHRIRFVNLTTGPVTVFGQSVQPGNITTVTGTGTTGFNGDNIQATAATITNPRSMAFDSAGNIFFSDTGNQRVRRVDRATGIITTVAGTGTAGYLNPPTCPAGDGCPATAARLRGPHGVAFDSAGNLYIGDNGNHRVRKVSTTGEITTVAGTGVAGFSGDGDLATGAQLNFPNGVAIDPSGNLHIADFGNNLIRFVNLSSSPDITVFGQTVALGKITTVAGNGIAGYNGDDIPATAASISGARNVALTSAGNLHIADDGNSRIRQVDLTTGIITTVAGGGVYLSGDGGPAIAAQLGGPFGIAFDFDGNLFIAQIGKSAVRMVSTMGVITTVAGDGSAGFNGDNIPATQAKIGLAFAVALDPSGNLYIADFLNNRIRKVDMTTGIITTVAGTSACIGGATPGMLCTNNSQCGAGGVCSPTAGGGFTGDGGPATAARLSGPQAVSFDSSGNLYIGDLGNGRIRKVDTSGNITTVAGGGTVLGEGGPATAGTLSVPRGLSFDSEGNLFIANANHRVRRVTPGDGSIDGLVLKPSSSACPPPTTESVTIGLINWCRDPREIITTVAGTGTACPLSTGPCGDSGQATAALLNSPFSAAVDSSDNLYIAENDNHRVRKVTRSPLPSDMPSGDGNIDGDPDEIISTVAGTGDSGFSGDGDLATAGQLNATRGLAFDPAGNLHISDGSNFRIRRLNLATPAIVDPGTLNLSSNGQSVTATIQFPADWDAAAINFASVRLQAIDPEDGALRYLSNQVLQTPCNACDPEKSTEDTNGDGVDDRLILKFDREAVVDWDTGDSTIELRVEGQFLPPLDSPVGTYFSGDTEIRIIHAQN